MKSTLKRGNVIFAGAGPGDPGLITVKLQEKLGIADVIIVDRLVNPEIIEMHASKNAAVIRVGKQGYHDASFSQPEITAMIVRHALKGKTVLRLKGGDVAFFSNVLDELISLRKYNVTYEIIPGITAASGASAYTGIPLTARGYSQAVQFLTYNPTTDYSSEKWRSLANADDTLVFYMAARNIFNLSEQLLQFSRKPMTPLAVIEQSTTAHQQIHITTIKACKVDFATKDFSSPSLVIVGKVLDLYHDFNWFHPREKGSVFRELVTETILH